MNMEHATKECANAYKIFPNIHDEGADKFHDGECAYQCKLELDYTCFKIHAPQTWQHDEGILPIHIFEKKMSDKWKMVLNNNDFAWPYDYDAFLDFNMAFWVKSLDHFILHWQSNKDEEFEYIGIEWSADYDLQIPDDEYTQNRLFYSILIHSPLSSINYEFISYSKPSNKLYKTIKWIHSDLPRATFKPQQPWLRSDGADIVPVRISRPTSSIDAIYDFYINIMESTLVHYTTSNIAMESESKMSMGTRTMFILLKDTAIELQFVERPNYYTTPDFTLKKFENMLIETHDTIITSPYCGQDRWFDNHYAYSTWTIPGLLDRVMAKLKDRGIVYRLFKSPYDHSSIYAKKNLDYYGVDSGYGMSIVEPTGQTFQVGGYLTDPYAQRFSPVGNPQWCYEPCPGGLLEGKIDPERVWFDPDDDYVAPDNIQEVDDEGDPLDEWTEEDNDPDYKQLMVEHEILNDNNNMHWIHGIGMIIPMLMCMLIFVSYKYGNDNEKHLDSHEYSPLIQQQ